MNFAFHVVGRNLVSMSSNVPAPVPVRIPSDTRIAIAAARFNGAIVAEVLHGCLKQLKALGMEEDRIEVHHVPGAFELPLAAKLLAMSREFSAVICLGCVIRGDTPHFDYVAGECARGIQDVALSESLPIIFGVLTTETEQQARDRINTGQRSADAAAEMIALRARLTS
jgi:6,7-dimethyl-8-ribityllumazine synthase